MSKEGHIGRKYQIETLNRSSKIGRDLACKNKERQAYEEFSYSKPGENSL
jgi:hypothetical protein